jgi:hypothetical protein
MGSLSLLIPLVSAFFGAAGSQATLAQPSDKEALLRNLAQAVRAYLIRNAPSPLYEGSPNWGHTAPAPSRLKWTGQGLDSQVHVVKTEKKDGTWRHVRLWADNLPQSLVVELRNLQQLEPGRSTFETLLAFDARVELERQKWKKGVRLYSTSARARFRVRLTLYCELTSRVEKNGGVLPELVLRLHVVKADLGYEHLVVEHVTGLGGDAAKALGDLIHQAVQQWHPSLERQLLARADAAIEKAVDTKEIRLGLGSLTRRAPPPPPPAPPARK